MAVFRTLADAESTQQRQATDLNYVMLRVLERSMKVCSRPYRLYSQPIGLGIKREIATSWNFIAKLFLMIMWPWP